MSGEDHRRLWSESSAKGIQSCTSLAINIREGAAQRVATAIVLGEPETIQRDIDDLREGSADLTRAAREYARAADVLVSVRKRTEKVARRGFRA